MWETLLANVAASKLGGSAGPGGGAGPIATTSRAESSADIGAQDFAFGNVSVGRRDKLTPWLAGGALLAALLAVLLVVKR